MRSTDDILKIMTEHEALHSEKQVDTDFWCDECEGETECTEECLCDSCRENKAEALSDKIHDTYD